MLLSSRPQSVDIRKISGCSTEEHFYEIALHSPICSLICYWSSCPGRCGPNVGQNSPLQDLHLFLHLGNFPFQPEIPFLKSLELSPGCFCSLLTSFTASTGCEIVEISHPPPLSCGDFVICHGDAGVAQVEIGDYKGCTRRRSGCNGA